MTQHECWRDVVGYEGLYLVSDQGRIMSLPRVIPFGKGTRYLEGRILSNALQKTGYERVLLYKHGKRRFVTVHRIVATAFVPNSEGLPCIDHINCVRNDNRASNLRWVTHQQNTQHMIDVGHYVNNSHALHTPEQVEATKQRQYKPIVRSDGMVFNSIMEAAQYMGYKNGNPSSISNHLHGLSKSCKGYTFEYLNEK